MYHEAKFASNNEPLEHSITMCYHGSVLSEPLGCFPLSLSTEDRVVNFESER